MKIPADIIRRKETKERLLEMQEALAVHWDLAQITRQERSRLLKEKLSEDTMTLEEIIIAEAYSSVTSALNNFDADPFDYS